MQWFFFQYPDGFRQIFFYRRATLKGQFAEPRLKKNTIELVVRVLVKK